MLRKVGAFIVSVAPAAWRCWLQSALPHHAYVGQSAMSGAIAWTKRTTIPANKASAIAS